MGVSSSKQTTKTDQTVKPVAPQYLQDQAQAYTGAITQAMSRDPNSRVLPANEAQLKAFEAAGNLGGWAGASDAAASSAVKAGNAAAAKAGVNTYDAIGYTPEQAQSFSLLDNLEAYQNPYTQQVVDATLADFDAQAGQTRAQLMADGARNKALGGSRFGVAQALAEGELARARATQDATLRSSAFETAARLSGEDANRRQQTELFNVGSRNESLQFGANSTNTASQFNAGEKNTTARNNAQLEEAAKQRALQASQVQAQIAAQKAEQARADLALQAQLAEQQRQIEMQQQNADLMQLQAIGQAQAMTPYQVLVGQNVTGTNVTNNSGSVVGSLLGLASLAPDSAWKKIGL